MFTIWIKVGFQLEFPVGYTLRKLSKK